MKLGLAFGLSLASLLLSGCMVSTSQNGPKPPKPDYEKAYQDYVRLGAEYMAYGRYDLAEPKLKRAIEINSQPPEAWNALGILYEETGNIAAGDDIYQRLISSHPDYELGYLNYATFLCKFNRDSERQSLYAQMRVKGPTFTALSYIAAGNCDNRRKRYAQASANYERALVYNAHAGAALLPLADIKIKQHNYSAALQYLNVVHTYVGYSPESVRLSIIAARNTGNKALENAMVQIMRSRYASTTEAKSLGL